jgi:hypothetical protein
MEIVVYGDKDCRVDADSAFEDAFSEGDRSPRLYEFAPISCGDDLPDGWGQRSLPYRYDGEGSGKNIGHILHGDERHCDCGYPLRLPVGEGTEVEFVGRLYHVSVDPEYHAAMRLADGRRLPFRCKHGEAIDFMKGRDRREVCARLRVVDGQWSLVSMVWAEQ